MNEPDYQDDREDQEKREDLVTRVFALLEDAAYIAAQCEARQAPQALRNGAAKLEDLVSEAATIDAAVAMLLREPNANAPPKDQPCAGTER